MNWVESQMIAMVRFWKEKMATKSASIVVRPTKEPIQRKRSARAGYRGGIPSP